MLAEPKKQLLDSLLQQLSKEELFWVNGYLNGMVAQSFPQQNTLVTIPVRKLTIAYGTETGNAKKLATELATKAKKKGHTTKLVALDQYRHTDLVNETHFVTVISTQGDGEPPIAAKPFYDHLHRNGFTIPQLKYAVLALGDTAYPLFCKTGEDIDGQFEKLGAKRFMPLQKCDLDYETSAHAWFDQLLLQLETATPSKADLTIPGIDTKKPAGKQTLQATLLQKIQLTADGSNKKIYHLALAAEGVSYVPGDSIGIVPHNPLSLVKDILRVTKTAEEAVIDWKGEQHTVGSLLQQKLNIHYLLEKNIRHYASLVGEEIPMIKTGLLHLLQQYPLPPSVPLTKLIEGLSPIAPRIYNIASSTAAHPGEIHITVLEDRFTIDGVAKTGLCTTFLQSKKEGDTIDFFIQTNKRFRLPSNETDLIMIGPGTGIAPFRSFVAERDATGAKGRNWLFFAEGKFTTDFLYQTEWQDWFATETLTQINLAFHEDGDHPVLIQDKIRQQGKQLYQWLQQGATLCLCGEKEPMSKEVEKAILDVLEAAGNLTPTAALAYFEQLKTSGRYLKDVY